MDRAKSLESLVPPVIRKPDPGLRRQNALLLLPMLGCGAALYLFNPAEWGFYPVCLFHRTTGLLCPGCGSLRAMHQLLHGHLVLACQFNILLVISLPFVAWHVARFAAASLRYERFSLAPRPIWWWLGLIILMIFGVLRNFPFAHSLWLAP